MASMSADNSQTVKLVIRQTADNAFVTAVPSYTNDPKFVAELAAKIRKSLLPGYYLDHPDQEADDGQVDSSAGRPEHQQGQPDGRHRENNTNGDAGD